MQNLKPLTSLYSWAGKFESYLVANPEDRFSLNVAHIIAASSIELKVFVWLVLQPFKIISLILSRANH